MPERTFEIGFLVFPDVTQLDFSGPWEVLTRLPGAACHLLADDAQPVRSGSGLTVLPTLTYASCPQLDMICVPGGPGHLNAMEDVRLLGFIRDQAPGCRYVTAVCTGGLVLAAAGLLRGYRATTHWSALDRLAAFGAIPVADRVVVDRDRITGGGVTAGIDFALTVVAEIAGEAFTRELQLQIEYAPHPPFDGGSPQTARPDTLETLEARNRQHASYIREVDQRALGRLA